MFPDYVIFILIYSIFTRSNLLFRQVFLNKTLLLKKEMKDLGGNFVFVSYDGVLWVKVLGEGFYLI